MTLQTLLLPLTSLALLTACSTSGSMEASTSPDSAKPVASTPPASQPDTTPSGVEATPPPQTTIYTSKDPFIEPTLSAACGWDKPTLYFATDSDRLGLISDVKVDLLATCLKAEPLQDRSVVLMGYADERGEEAYNSELGLDRANAVKDELIAQGVPAERIETYSRGEYLADGDDKLVDDRRVVVKLNR